ncbi:hypothetical protein CAter282_0801 [Collimonas arenae]|uniref:Uncharacterized protein n=1 Tax=Collimonas arenae TaxID=279058 RepID=A0A127QF30_9BURK|nr:hypothetical protein CAter282_0801 [Collimonas arenae]
MKAGRETDIGFSGYPVHSPYNRLEFPKVIHENKERLGIAVTR